MDIFTEVKNAEKKEEAFHSKAVIASYSDGGLVLWFTGDSLYGEIDGAGSRDLDDLGLSGAPDGISIWEGHYAWSQGSWEYPQDGETYPVGKFRDPTEEEWQAIKEGRNPWETEDDRSKEPSAGTDGESSSTSDSRE